MASLESITSDSSNSNSKLVSGQLLRQFIYRVHLAFLRLTSSPEERLMHHFLLANAFEALESYRTFEFICHSFWLLHPSKPIFRDQSGHKKQNPHFCLSINSVATLVCGNRGKKSSTMIICGLYTQTTMSSPYTKKILLVRENRSRASVTTRSVIALVVNFRRGIITYRNLHLNQVHG